ncbi:hypothetical protein [Streptomyces carpinensis]|uniref:Uncharacterized protein n=1 Tax=Streptomyces carpinensis TaxID=66369 RepID=A0ABV1VUT5_9ACTN|nr:hypothetical protein [Streptomyces carpinensis]
MSGCCGQGPVIVSGAAATPRVDTEGTLLCDVLPDGTLAGVALVEAIYDASSGERVGTRTVDPVTGAPYTPVGTLQACLPAASPDCESPTTPTATVGLCLADGSPIAVTVVRDCTGAVTSEGWLNLTTGAYSAGAPPAGTVACGDARTITVSGTFCDVDAAGEVVGLVLVEYTYGEDGAVSAVRLVDAVTGGTYTPAGTVTVCPAGVEQPERDVVQLCDTSADGTVTAFVRDYARDENGAIVGHSDYGLDGAPYTPVGTIGTCDPDCRQCETIELCDSDPSGASTTSLEIASVLEFFAAGGQVDAPAATARTLMDGGTAVTGPDTAAFNGTVVRSVAWRVVADCPDCVDETGTVTVTASIDVEALGPDITCGATGGLNLFNGTSIVAGDGMPNNTPVGFTDTLTVSAAVPVSALLAGDIYIRFGADTGQNNSSCGNVHNSWQLSAFTYSTTALPTAAGCGKSFLRTVCRDCTGAVTSTADYEPDGVTPYTPVGAVGPCITCPGPGCCQPVQVCIAATATETIEFVSNEAKVYDNTVDTVWTWTPTGDANGPAANATWYNMYRTQFGPAWSATDTAPTRKAGWVSPHPNARTANTGLPGEGPTLSGSVASPQPWWARASFSLPAAADPASIRVQITVLNADQVAKRFRLNNGAWQTMTGGSYQGAAYTFGPGTLPGAQPGTNTLYFEVDETVVDSPSNGAGVMAHFIVTYDVPGLGVRSWTRMVCCDGSAYYLDEDGARQEELPPSSALVACGSSPDPVALCDDNGTFLRHVSYVGDQVLTTDTDLNGSAYAPVGPVRSCGSTQQADQPVQTGIRRVTGTTAQALKTEFPGLQSVSLSVLADVVNVTMTNGAAQPVPAGATLTWSVTDTDDSSLSLATFAGASAAASYLVNWTYKTTAAG